MAQNALSIVEYFYDSGITKHPCGYCEKQNSYRRDGIWAHYLTVENYQRLIDRGWRRSGLYCYKPYNIETCCPMYTIRCNALDFVVTKSQKKIIKRMTKFLKDGGKMTEEESRRKKKSDKDELHEIGACSNAEFPEAEFAEFSARAHKDILQNEPMLLATNCEKRLSQCHEDVIESKIKRETPQDHDTPQPQPVIPSKHPQPTKIPPNRDEMPRKKKLMRIERARNRLLAQGKTLEEIEDFYRKKKMASAGKSIEELLSEVKDGQNKLEIKLVRVSSEEFIGARYESVELFKKYQEAVHNDKPESQTLNSFMNFLGKSPLIHWHVRRGPPMGYGSFHQQYRLNGKLIAVGVIDILPYCVSSVYLFYDPEYSFLSLGTFSSLIEIQLVRELHKSASDLKYYYMGYYIHEIPKMRYKAKIKPSFLLCPDVCTWHPIEECTPKLDRQKFSRFNEDIHAVDEEEQITPEDIRQVRVLYRGESHKLYGEVQEIERRKGRRDDSREVKLYAQLVGKTCAKSMSLCRP